MRFNFENNYNKLLDRKLWNSICTKHKKCDWYFEIFEILKYLSKLNICFCFNISITASLREIIN